MPLTPSQLNRINELVTEIEKDVGFGEVRIIIKRKKPCLLGVFVTVDLDEPCEGDYPMPKEVWHRG